jgi:hypothetical protein
MELSNEFKVQDPDLNKVWKGLKKREKTRIVFLFELRFKKSGQVIRRGVRDRGFFQFEAQFLKEKLIELQFATLEDFPGFQLPITFQKENAA